MDGSQWSLQDAKNRFSTVVEAASKGEPQTVTKRGKRTVVVLAAEEYDRLTGKAADRPSFVDHLLDFPRGKGRFKFESGKLKMRDIKFR
jgi:prevent-host-death family protein